MATPEQLARDEIDQLLTAAGWSVCNADQANITAHRGVAIREFQLKKGHGFADYMLYVDGKAAGVIEAKKAGATLVGVKRSPANTPPACQTLCPPGAARCRSSTSPPAWKRASRTASTRGAPLPPGLRLPPTRTLADWLAEPEAPDNVSAETSQEAEAAPEYVTRTPPS